MNQQSKIIGASLQQRVIKAAEQILSKQNYVRPIDLMITIGWLQNAHAKSWQQGKVPFLEKVIQVNLNKLNQALEYLQQWALKKDLKSSETIYMSHNTKTRKLLRFSNSGNPGIEQKYRTHYISPILTEKKIERLKNKWEQSPDLVVFSLINDSECSECYKKLLKGNLLFKDGDNAKCITCSGLINLVFLPSGDAKLTRRAKSYSTKPVVVVRFSKVRKRYERQGIMVEEEALRKAQSEINYQR
jgi:hypothetical protein